MDGEDRPRSLFEHSSKLKVELANDLPPPTSGHLLLPLPVCLGLASSHLAEGFVSEEDIRQFWKGYAIGGGAFVILLILELGVICLL